MAPNHNYTYWNHRQQSQPITMTNRLSQWHRLVNNFPNQESLIVPIILKPEKIEKKNQ